MNHSSAIALLALLLSAWLCSSCTQQQAESHTIADGKPIGHVPTEGVASATASGNNTVVSTGGGHGATGPTVLSGSNSALSRDSMHGAITGSDSDPVAASPLPHVLPVITPLPPIGFQKGVNHAHVHRRGHGYGSDVSARELDSLKDVGVNWIAITPFGYQPGATVDEIVGFGEGDTYTGRDRSMTDEDLLAEAQSAHQRGIRVTLKPQIWSRDFHNGAEWHGTIRQNTPEEHARWWKSYRKLALHYAKVAERGEIDIYCIGTELVKMSTVYPDEWRKLIADIRKVYSGRLTYAAHWDKEYSGITFWDALDYIGVGAYFPLDVPDSASVEALVAVWGPYKKKLAELSATYKRPVLFVEAGYRPVTGAYRQPWLYSGGEYSPVIQARAYDALFKALCTERWFAGVYMWKTFTDPSMAGRYGENLDFCFRGLPAEGVLRRWYTSTSFAGGRNIQ